MLAVFARSADRTSLFSAMTILLALMLVLPIPACRSGRRIAAENDRLRNEVVDLQGEIAVLTRRNAELEAELTREAIAPGSQPQEIREVMPHVTAISIGRLSHSRDSNKDGTLDEIMLFIHPVDGRGRFVQLVGEISASATVLPVDADAISIGRSKFSPSAVRDAYRSFITGVHYSFIVPIQLPESSNSAKPAESCTVRVVYHDGLTGGTFAAERSISLK